MSVSLQQYRSSIGSYNNFLKSRESKACLKGQFWNTMLMLFYLNVFYFPVLKDSIERVKCSNEVVFLFHQTLYYNVFVPLLIRLANDVEENPGPTTTIHDIVEPNDTVFANYSQGNQLRFGPNAGNQCVAMALTAIIFKHIKSMNNWNSADLNNILFHGNSLYNCIRSSIQTDLLLLTDVPEMVSINNQIYSLNYSESITGDIFMTTNNEPYFSLENAFNELLIGNEENNKCFLLTIGCNTVAVFKMLDGKFKIFDSHSRNLVGMADFNGQCILLSVQNLQNLVAFFQMTSHQGRCVPFELKGVLINFEQLFPNSCNHGDLSTNYHTGKKEICNKKRKPDENQMKTKQTGLVVNLNFKKLKKMKL